MLSIVSMVDLCLISWVLSSDTILALCSMFLISKTSKSFLVDVKLISALNSISKGESALTNADTSFSNEK